jgi:primosomal protein N' (replication factor Y)
MEKTYLQISVLKGPPENLTYFSYENLNLEIGDFVKIPIQKRFSWGIINSISKINPDFETKEILSYIKAEQTFHKFLHILSEHYLINLSSIYSRTSRTLIQKKILKKLESKENKNIINSEKKSFNMNSEQNSTFEKIKKTISTKKGEVSYLYGITGSGKTIVYLFLIEYTILKNKKNVVVILPDISLSNDFNQKANIFFNNKIKIFQLTAETSQSEKNELLEFTLKNENFLLIGVHIPVYFPIKNIGLYVVDEEHDSGFVEKKYPFSNSRDLILWRAKIENTNVILGSATPSIDSWYYINQKKWTLYRLKNRYFNFPITKIEKIILSKETTIKQSAWLTKELYETIKNTLLNKKQILIYLNKRGLYGVLYCNCCRKAMHCSKCSSLYTIYEHFIAKCHRCSEKILLSNKCLYCKSEKHFLTTKGIGSSYLRILLQKLFPEAHIEQADTSTIVNRKMWETIKTKMQNKEIDILVGTQMISRGYHFENIGLVGIIFGDMHLSIPHLSSAEKTVQNIIQVAGRSGRECEAKVIMQTLTENKIFEYASEENYEKFFDYELKFREKFEYYPFKKNALILISGFNEIEVKNHANKIYEKIKEFNIFYEPCKSLVYKTKNKYCYCLYGTAKKYEELKNIAKTAYLIPKNKNIDVYYLPNPSNYGYNI